jgi:hypothetical protein
MFLQIFMMNQLCNEFLTNHSIEKSNDVLPRLIALTIPNQLFNLEAFKSSLTMPSHHLHLFTLLVLMCCGRMMVLKSTSNHLIIFTVLSCMLK